MINMSALLANAMRSSLAAALVIVVCLFCAEGRAQNGSPSVSPAATAPTGQVAGGAATPPPSLTANPPAPPPVPPAFDSTSGYEYRLTILIIVCALGVLLMLFFLLLRVRNLKADDMLRTFGVVLIIMGTLFLIAAGYSAMQIASALGLFGTIAGYLVGRSERRSETEKEGKHA